MFEIIIPILVAALFGLIGTMYWDLKTTVQETNRIVRYHLRPNGKPSLVDRVDAIEHRLDKIEEKVANLEEVK